MFKVKKKEKKFKVFITLVNWDMGHNISYFFRGKLENEQRVRKKNVTLVKQEYSITHETISS